MDIPDPDKVLTDLSPIHGVLYESLEHGAFKAKKFFSREFGDKEPICPYWGAHTIRLCTRRKLIGLGHAVTDEDADHEIATETLPLNGLCITFTRRRLRILKSDGGGLPVPSSDDRIAFYHQQGYLFTPAGSMAPSKSVNLVVTWDVDADYNLRPLRLVMPKSGGRRRELVAEYWSREIPYPDALGGQTGKKMTTPPTEDLPYGLKEKAEGKDSND